MLTFEHGGEVIYNGQKCAVRDTSRLPGHLPIQPIVRESQIPAPPMWVMTDDVKPAEDDKEWPAQAAQ